MALQSQIYPELLNIIRDLAGGGMIQLRRTSPTSINRMRAKIYAARAVAGCLGGRARETTKAGLGRGRLRICGRHDQYEKFYAGAPFIVKQRFLWNFDFELPDRLVSKAGRLRHEWAALTSARSTNRPTYCWGGRRPSRHCACRSTIGTFRRARNQAHRHSQPVALKSMIGRTIGAPNSAERLMPAECKARGCQI